jgi:lipopolysaccharide transport system permease protein
MYMASQTAEQTDTDPFQADSGAFMAAESSSTAPPDEHRESLRSALAEMAAELVQHRELLWQMVVRDLKIRYKQAVMGFAWAIFMPVVIVGSGLVVKYAMAQMSGGAIDGPGISGMAVKALGWAFFAGGVGFAVSSLTGNLNLVTKIYFPREVFPLSAVATQMFDSAVGGMGVLAVLLLIAGTGISIQWLWAAPLIALLVLFTAAAALALSCANVFFRDVKYIVQIILTFGIFFTPVFYDPQVFGPTGCTWMMLNPLTPLLEGLRLAVVEHHNLLSPLVVVSARGAEILAWSPWYLAYSAAWSVLGLLVSWRLFHKLEFIYAEYI